MTKTRKINRFSYKLLTCLIQYLFYFSILFFPCQLAHAEDLVIVDFSDNLRIQIRQIHLKGKQFITKPFLADHYDFYEGGFYWIWQLKEKVENLKNSGYIVQKTYKYYLKKVEGKVDYEDTYDLYLIFDEIPKIFKINITNNSKTDSETFLDFLADHHFGEKKIANRQNYDKAKRQFYEYYQERGIFLIEISEAVYELPEMDGLLLEITINPIKKLHVTFIKVGGTKNVTYKEILSNLNFSFNDIITDNDTLYHSLIKIKQTGLFSNVYFKFRKLSEREKADKDKQDKQTNYYDVIIEVKEVDLEEFGTTTLVSSTIGPILLVQYVNYNLNGERDRLFIQAGYETAIESLIFLVEYSIPDIYNTFFFSVRFQKEDFVSEISDSVDKLTEIMSMKFTFGMTFIDFFSGYLVFKQSHYKESALDHNTKERISQPANVTLNNNEFDYQFGFILMYNSLNDTFNPIRGIRTILYYDLIPEKKSWAHTLELKGDFYVPIHRYITLGFYLHNSYLFTEYNNLTLFSYANQRSNAQSRNLNLIRSTLFASVEIRFSTKAILDDSYFVFFLEAGGLWERLRDIHPKDIGYGIGIGLRWAPNKYYHSFIFGFPGSINIGIRLNKKDYNSPIFTLLQHRDQFFYLNLTGGF